MIQFLKTLKRFKKAGVISQQQYKTIKGQVYGGDLEGARKGLTKLVKRELNKHDVEREIN